MKRFFATVFHLTASLLIAAAHSHAAEPTPGIIASVADYQLRAADVIQVKIFQEDDLTREVSISQEMSISLPLIGSVDVRNRTVRQVEELVRQLYDKDFLVNPQVTVVVMKYAERTVSVTGSVNNPGPVEFPVERGLSLLEAIARAGGHSRLANLSQVRITRQGKNGQPETITIDATKTEAASLFQLQIGDAVFVRERIL